MLKKPISKEEWEKMISRDDAFDELVINRYIEAINQHIEWCIFNPEYHPSHISLRVDNERGDYVVPSEKIQGRLKDLYVKENGWADLQFHISSEYNYVLINIR